MSGNINFEPKWPLGKAIRTHQNDLKWDLESKSPKVAEERTGVWWLCVDRIEVVAVGASDEVVAAEFGKTSCLARGGIGLDRLSWMTEGSDSRVNGLKMETRRCWWPWPSAEWGTFLLERSRSIIGLGRWRRSRKEISTASTRLVDDFCALKQYFFSGLLNSYPKVLIIQVTQGQIRSNRRISSDLNGSGSYRL